MEYSYEIADPKWSYTSTIEEIEAQLSDNENGIFNEEVRRANAGEESLFDEKLCKGEFGFLGAAYVARIMGGLKPHPSIKASLPKHRSRRRQQKDA